MKMLFEGDENRILKLKKELKTRLQRNKITCKVIEEPKKEEKEPKKTKKS